jgi:ribosome recycling factor
LSDELQKMTDESVHEVDAALTAKEQEIMHV